MLVFLEKPKVIKKLSKKCKGFQRKTRGIFFIYHARIVIAKLLNYNLLGKWKNLCQEVVLFMDAKVVGQNIAKLRRKHNMTQKELADALFVVD